MCVWSLLIDFTYCAFFFNFVGGIFGFYFLTEGYGGGF